MEGTAPNVASVPPACIFAREVVMLASEQADGENLSASHDTPWLAAVQMFLLCDVLFFFFFNDENIPQFISEA